MKKNILILISISIFILFIGIIYAARLPTVNGDSDAWGTVLNEYLQIEHDTNGTHGNINATSVIEIRNAAKFSGSDIGAKINAAIANFTDNKPGIVIVPPTSWGGQNYSTQIVVNRSVHIIFPGRDIYANYMGEESAIKITSHRSEITSFAVNLDGNSNSNVDGILIYGASDVIIDGGAYIINPVRHGIFIDAGNSGAYHNNFFGTIRIVSPGGNNILLNSSGTAQPNANHFYGLVLNTPPTGFAGIRIARGYANSFNDVYIQSGQSDSWAVYNSGSFNKITGITIDGDMPNGVKIDSGNLYISGLQNNAAVKESINGGNLFQLQYDGDIFTQGNIGIGTSSPTHKLSVIGDMNISGNAFIGNSTLFVNNSGNVGIGTTNATAKLEIRDNGYTGSSLFKITSDDNVPWHLTLRNNAAATGLDWNMFVSSLNSLSFYTTNAAGHTMTLTNDKKVGIGTSSPESILHLLGTSHTYMQIGSNGSNTFDRGIRFDNQSGSAAGYILLVPNTIGVDSIMKFFIGGATSSDIKMVITDNGNVGIGTSTPNYLFEIAKNETALNVSGNLYVNSTNVGIGTSSPTKNLEISGSNVSIGVNSILPSVNLTIFSGLSGGLNRSVILSTGNLSFGAGGSTVITLIGSGNVGIGTTNPTEILHILKTSGDAKVSIVASDAINDAYIDLESANSQWLVGIDKGDSNKFKIANAATLSAGTGQYFNIDTSGNVGIGTITPGKKLSVVGTINQTGCTTAGTLSTNAGGDIICTSDERLKDIHGMYYGGLDIIKEINPIIFNLKNETYTHIGFSAQNIQKVIPEATPEQVNGYLGFDQAPVIAALVNSIKELNNKTISQQKIIISQNETINNQQAQINQIQSQLSKICTNNPEMCK